MESFPCDLAPEVNLQKRASLQAGGKARVWERRDGKEMVLCVKSQLSFTEKHPSHK